jgi:hypothetical protein
MPDEHIDKFNFKNKINDSVLNNLFCFLNKN